PHLRGGVLFEDFKRAWGQDDSDLLVWRTPSALMNPSLTPNGSSASAGSIPPCSRGGTRPRSLGEGVDDPGLVRELQTLERRAQAGGRVMIDHLRGSRRSHQRLALAAAAAMRRRHAELGMPVDIGANGQAPHLGHAEVSRWEGIERLARTSQSG